MPGARIIPLRVLVLTTVCSATIPLSFGRLSPKSKYIFKFGGLEIQAFELAQADVAILVRDAVALDKYKKMCLSLQIPCYYYLDDNFWILGGRLTKTMTI